LNKNRFNLCETKLEKDKDKCMVYVEIDPMRIV